MSTYSDWGPADWTVGALVGELKDNCPTGDLDDARLEIVTPDGRHLQVTAMRQHGHHLHLVIDPLDDVQQRRAARTATS
jgi:hypothetical protein